jgi:hypothetical protein
MLHSRLIEGRRNHFVQAYYDPLTRKTFRSKNTYLAAINSKRYKDALRKSGQPAPEPVVSLGNQPPPPVTGKAYIPSIFDKWNERCFLHCVSFMLGN